MEVLICLYEHPPCNVVQETQHVVRSNMTRTGTEVLLSGKHRVIIYWKSKQISFVTL